MTSDDSGLSDALARITERAKTYSRLNPEPAHIQRRKHEEGGLASAAPASSPDPTHARAPDDELADARGGPDDAAAATYADVALLVALPRPELEQVQSVLKAEWRTEYRQGVVYKLGSVEIGSSRLSIVAAAQTAMGLVSAAILATKTLAAWRPSLLAMVGICAGVSDRVRLGDVIVARQVFDYGSGKLTGGKLVPDYEPISLNDQLCGFAMDLANDAEQLRAIRNAWPVRAGRPDNDLSAHVGSLASGAAVVADSDVVKGIVEHKRSLLGVEMEAYAIAKAAVSAQPATQWLIVKGVQDYADPAKNDVYRDYSAFVSVEFMRRFLERYWTEIRLSPRPPIS